MPWRKCFLLNEIGRIDGRRGFRTREKVFRIGGNTFYDQKNKILMKIPESKRSEIKNIAEFRGIPNRFPNLGSIRCPCQQIYPPCHVVLDVIEFLEDIKEVGEVF